VIQLAKIQIQDEWFARGRKTSLRADRCLEGRTSGTFTRTAQMGLFASIQAATVIFSTQEERDQIQEEFRW